jgi:hypothetical protein
VWRGGSESAALLIASRCPMGFQATLMAWIIGCTHPLQVLGENLKAHLRSHLFERSHPEAGSAHPRLDSPGRMLCGLTLDAHTLGRSVQPHLHRDEDGFVLPLLDTPFFGRRALRFHIADRGGATGRFSLGFRFRAGPSRDGQAGRASMTLTGESACTTRLSRKLALLRSVRYSASVRS